MPELPDLQVFSKNLNTLLKGKKVTAVTVHSKRTKTPHKDFKKLEGQQVQAVMREGKQLHLQFGGGTVLALHLMLHGELHRFDGKKEPPHTVLALGFDDGSGLALTDWQGAANPTLDPAAPAAPDALSEKAGLAFWKQKLQGRAAIKNILLDQKVVRGIGNAYADEILWKAGISPFSVAGKIPADKITALSKAIRSVLSGAEKQILRSHPDIISGEVRDFLDIHHAKKSHSPTGGVIQTKMVGGRKTYYTDEQELYR